MSTQTIPVVIDTNRAAPTAACLIHIYPTDSLLGRRYALGDAPVTLGRGSECDVSIADGSVSRVHARIAPVGGEYAVTDNGSTNGTYINSSRIGGTTVLRDGDSLSVGKCLYRFLAGGNLEAAYHEEIYRMTILDGLTQVHNRRYLNEFLDLELARAERHLRPVSLLLFDIDRFKSINDTHGHLCGDAVLREVAGRVRATVRKGELLARYGGEEFAVVLPETPPEQAAEAAERIRGLVADGPFGYEKRSHHVTVSVGVSWTCGDAAVTPAELIAVADRRLYRAKQTGRNRVVAWESESSPLALAAAEGRP